MSHKYPFHEDFGFASARSWDPPSLLPDTTAFSASPMMDYYSEIKDNCPACRIFVVGSHSDSAEVSRYKYAGGRFLIITKDHVSHPCSTGFS